MKISGAGLTRGEWVAVSGGLVLAFSLFALPWFAVTAEGFVQPGRDGRAFEVLGGLDVILLQVALVPLVVPLVRGMRPGDWAPRLVAAAGLVGALVTLYLILAPPEPDVLVPGATESNSHFGLTAQAGAFVGLIASIVILAGGAMALGATAPAAPAPAIATAPPPPPEERQPAISPIVPAAAPAKPRARRKPAGAAPKPARAKRTGTAKKPATAKRTTKPAARKKPAKAARKTQSTTRSRGLRRRSASRPQPRLSYASSGSARRRRAGCSGTATSSVSCPAWASSTWCPGCRRRRSQSSSRSFAPDAYAQGAQRALGHRGAGEADLLVEERRLAVCHVAVR